MKKYKISYLYYFFYGMIICWFAFLIKFVLDEVLTKYFQMDIDFRVTMAIAMFRFPLLIIAHYLFMVYLILLVRNKFPKLISYIYLTLSVFAYIYYILILNQALSRSYQYDIKIYFKIIFLVQTTVLIVSSLYVFFFGLKEKLKEKRKFLLFNGIYTFTIFIIGILDSFGVISIYKHGVSSYILQVTQHSPLVIYLYYYIRKQFVKIDDNTEYFKSVVSKYSLTKREREIVRFLLQGSSIKEISDSLFLSYKTVDKHVENIYRKLNIHSKIHLYNLFK